MRKGEPRDPAATQNGFSALHPAVCSTGEDRASSDPERSGCRWVAGRFVEWRNGNGMGKLPLPGRIDCNLDSYLPASGFSPRLHAGRSELSPIAIRSP